MRRAASGWLSPPAPIVPGQRIGLLGGSFNPPHSGHLHVSEVALARLRLDFVWWLVSPQNPLKPVAGMAPLPERLADARATALHPRILVLDVERMVHTRYTVDTLKALQRRFPQLDFIWLMGSDNLAGFHRWRRWPEIVERVPIAVITRGGSAVAALHARPLLRYPRARRASSGIASRPPAIAILDGRRNPQSSTALRNAAMTGEAMAASVGPC
ncbi:MAG: nicotinate-nucleotide adenylyltransferase [Alphaproteobacteria bacterium]|nr:nicotinate-nucleotide adenylyltransferase [Alphaproteobacteria bacterium]